MWYYEIIDSGNKMLKTKKSYLQNEKQAFKQKDIQIYGMQDIYNRYQLYLISIVVLILILMFPFGNNESLTIYSMT